MDARSLFRVLGMYNFEFMPGPFAGDFLPMSSRYGNFTFHNFSLSVNKENYINALFFYRSNLGLKAKFSSESIFLVRSKTIFTPPGLIIV